MTRGITLGGPLDRAALRRAIETLVGRHEALRTRFIEMDRETLQIVEDVGAIPMASVDLREVESHEQHRTVLEAIRLERAESFDLACSPMVRVRLLSTREEEQVLIRTIHHIACDVWSEQIFDRELQLLYRAYRERRSNPLVPLRLQYADFTIWQRKWLETPAASEAMTYWSRQLAGIPTMLNLPMVGVRPASQRFDGEILHLVLSTSQGSVVKRLGRANHTTPYMTLLALFGVLLSRYSGSEDIVLGCPSTNRPDPELEKVIGFFINSVVMRLRVTPTVGFREFLAHVRRTAIDAYRYQNVPFERLVQEFAPLRRLDTTPIFQVMFGSRNVLSPHPGSRRQDYLTDGSNEPQLTFGGAMSVRFELEVYTWERNGRIGLSWIYNRDLFDQARIERMVQHYVQLLGAVDANSDGPIGRIPLLDTEEWRKSMQPWN